MRGSFSGTRPWRGKCLSGNVLGHHANDLSFAKYQLLEKYNNDTQEII